MAKIRNYAAGDEPVPGYRLIAFLGSGTFGDVWRSTAPGGTVVAIKIINLGMKGALKEFRSLRLVKKIHYPNLVPILAIWLKDEQGNVLEEAAFETVSDASRIAGRGTMLASTVNITRQAEPAELIIAMGLGEKSLADRLEECRQQNLQGIPVEELLNYMQDAARAIDYLNSPHHELGSEPKAIQHCDIKPPNILIVGDAAQVCDFSLARALDDLRKTSLSLTIVYAAPEVIESNTPSPTTDQYSLAVSYVELRTGELPFPPEATAPMVMQAHLDSKLDLSGLLPAEREVIRRGTARKATERFASCSELVLALRQAVRPQPVARTRRAWPWLAAACLALALPIALWKYVIDESKDLQLPTGFMAAEGSNPVGIHGLRCPDQIICTRHELKVPFRLVHGGEISPFYMMENKVSRGQFGRFARENPDKVKDSKWEVDECGLPATLSASDREQLPVFNVTCAEASFFAHWLGSENGESLVLGELPTVDQWDAAAGFVKGQESLDRGPFLQPWDATKPRDEQVAVNRGTKGPLPVGTATHDISVFGCRDMAGNGYEWTLSPRDRAGKFDPKNPDERISMVLRGHAFADDNPLRFKEMEEPDPPTWSCTGQRCEIDFRVVVRFDELL